MIQKNKQTKNKKFRSCRRGDCYVREFFISCVTAPIAVHSVFAMLLLQICFQIVQHYLIAIGIHVYSFYLWVKDPPEFFLDPVGIRSCFISFHPSDLRLPAVRQRDIQVLLSRMAEHGCDLGIEGGL